MMGRYVVIALSLLGVAANAQCVDDEVLEDFRAGIAYFENTAEAQRLTLLARELRRDAYEDGILSGSSEYLDPDIFSFSTNVDVANGLMQILQELTEVLDDLGDRNVRNAITQLLGCSIDLSEYDARIDAVFAEAQTNVEEFQNNNDAILTNLDLRDYAYAMETIVGGGNVNRLVDNSRLTLEAAEERFRDTEQSLQVRRQERLEQEQALARRAEAELVCPWPTNSPAFAAGPIDEVQLCLDAGVDPNVASGYLLSPLHIAARDNDDPSVVIALLNAGADPNAPMAALDSNAHQNMTPMFFAAFGNPNPDVIRALVSGGADVNARDSRRATPLWHAAQKNDNPAVIDALIEADADPNAQDIQGTPPLHWAALVNQGVVEALLRGGANPNLRDNFGDLPLHIAILNVATGGDVEIVHTLIEGGANPNGRDSGGQTALHVAMGLGNSAVVDVLLAAGADPSIRDVSGNTPADVR